MGKRDHGITRRTALKASDRPDIGTIQLVGGGVRDVALYEALQGVRTIVTFNGSSFDLPVIRKRIYADLKRDLRNWARHRRYQRLGCPAPVASLRDQ